MPYDEDLARRICELLAVEPDVAEQQMFGGLAFLISGNMSVAASGQGGLMVRVDPEGLRTEQQLSPWVRRGVAFARSLPAKR